MGDTLTIYLIRHERTKANVERKYIGHTDESILPLAPVTLNLQPNIIYGSDLKRCEETASHYFPTVPYKKYTALREMNFGQFEMKTYDQLQDDEHYRAWLDDPLHITPKGGESFLAFSTRVRGVLQAIVTKPQTYTLIVHGGVIRVLLAQFTGRDFRELHAAHQTIYRCQWDFFDDWKEGKKCTSISEEPIMARRST